MICRCLCCFFFSSRRRHTRYWRDWSSDVCSSDLVASTGLFTDVSQKTDVNLKNTIGKLAYYVKGIEQIPSFRKLKIKVTSDHMEFDDNMYLMLVFNGKTAGNFHLAYKAEDRKSTRLNSSHANISYAVFC